MSSIDARLARIAQAVHELDARDPHRVVFGAAKGWGHEYVLNAPASERYVFTIEKKHRAKFPAAYRRFLTTVADGGAGPSYGVKSLSAALEDQKRLDEPFPHGNEAAARLMRLRVTKEEEYAFIGEDELARGVLALCDDGCGWTTYLVISGEQRGKIWVGGELGYTPRYFMRRGAPVQHTFLSWYEAWLRASFRETKKKPFVAPAGKNFRLQGKLIGELPAALFDHAEIEALDVANNHLAEIPEAIGRLRALRELDVGGNELRTLPDSIGNLASLEKLALHHNRFEELPAAVFRLTALRSLSAVSNPIVELGADMGNLRSLRELSLGDTQIRTLPSSLAETPLEELTLYGVPIDDWECLRPLATRGSLRMLSLSMNPRLEAIPDSVFALGSLRHLIVGGTRVSTIPAQIRRLSNLESLGLASTRVSALPNALDELPKLRQVVLQRTAVSKKELERARKRWPSITFAT